tara:strand:+ start:111 stop:491 length:381 start_codon:yes stop_codon:yes gene_type:complete
MLAQSAAKLASDLLIQPSSVQVKKRPSALIAGDEIEELTASKTIAVNRLLGKNIIPSADNTTMLTIEQYTAIMALYLTARERSPLFSGVTANLERQEIYSVLYTVIECLKITLQLQNIFICVVFAS